MCRLSPKLKVQNLSHNKDAWLFTILFFNQPFYLRGQDTYGRIIKWTQHISFLTLAGMERVVERNHGNGLKEG